MSVPHIWLASYPRSGNTLLRTVLYNCFGLVSASITAKDLGGNKKLEAYVGHVEHGPDGRVNFPDNALPLYKTHRHPPNRQKAIYIVRDGRAVCVSFWEFYGRQMSLEQIISGKHLFGTWADHLSAWHPWSRPDTLLLRYEDIVNNFDAVLNEISGFLDVELLSKSIPARETIAKDDGRWVRKKSDWQELLTGAHLDLFHRTNGEMMKFMGYDGA